MTSAPPADLLTTSPAWPRLGTAPLPTFPFPHALFTLLELSVTVRTYVHTEVIYPVEVVRVV